MMTAPMDIAAERLEAAINTALVGCGFSSTGALATDDRATLEADGEAEGHQTLAAFYFVDAKPVRALMGGATRRWVVEGEFRLETASFGATPTGWPTHKALLDELLSAIAVLPEEDPTLGQTCERLEIEELQEDDFHVGGLKRSFTFIIRLRAGDRFGRTAP